MGLQNCPYCCNTRTVPTRPEYVSHNRTVPEYVWIDCPDCEDVDVQARNAIEGHKEMRDE